MDYQRLSESLDTKEADTLGHKSQDQCQGVHKQITHELVHLWTFWEHEARLQFFARRLQKSVKAQVGLEVNISTVRAKLDTDHPAASSLLIVSNSHHY